MPMLLEAVCHSENQHGHIIEVKIKFGLDLPVRGEVHGASDQCIPWVRWILEHFKIQCVAAAQGDISADHGFRIPVRGSSKQGGCVAIDFAPVAKAPRVNPDVDGVTEGSTEIGCGKDRVERGEKFL